MLELIIPLLLMHACSAAPASVLQSGDAFNTSAAMVFHTRPASPAPVDSAAARPPRALAAPADLAPILAYASASETPISKSLFGSAYEASGLANTSFLDEPSTNFTLLVPTDKALRDYVQALPPQLRGHLPSPLLQALDIKPGVRGVLTAELLPVGRTFLQVLIAYHLLPRGSFFVPGPDGSIPPGPAQGGGKLLSGSTYKTALGDLASTLANASRAPGDNSTIPYGSSVFTNLTFVSRAPGKLVAVGANSTQADLTANNVWIAPNPGVVHVINRVLSPPAAVLGLIALPTGQPLVLDDPTEGPGKGAGGRGRVGQFLGDLFVGAVGGAVGAVGQQPVGAVVQQPAVAVVQQPVGAVVQQPVGEVVQQPVGIQQPAGVVVQQPVGGVPMVVQQPAAAIVPQAVVQNLPG